MTSAHSNAAFKFALAMLFFVDINSAFALTYDETACVARAYGEGQDPSKCFSSADEGGAGSGGSGTAASGAAATGLGGGVTKTPAGGCATPSWFPNPVTESIAGTFQGEADKLFDGVFYNSEAFDAAPTSNASPLPSSYHFLRLYRSLTLENWWVEYDKSGTEVNFETCVALIDD